MFGLMRACSCNKSSEERELQRLHYCGTCKSIGRLYGQKARLFLNYDAVFLGELLTDLQPRRAEFSRAYVSKNCLAIPRRDQIPWALEYAAAANVVLAQFKLLDHVADRGSRLIKTAVRVYAQEFERAREALERCHFPFQELRSLLSQQNEREQEPLPRLERVAEPTAGATKLFFRHGAVTSAADSPTTTTMASLGMVFGEIAYVVDAIQDQKEDAEKGAFNALTATGTSPARAKQLLGAKQEEMLAHLDALPIDLDRKRTYASRLAKNLSPYLFMRRPGPDRVVIIREDRRGQGCCQDCYNAICCCEAIQCCDCVGSDCCNCICSGCGVLS